MLVSKVRAIFVSNWATDVKRIVQCAMGNTSVKPHYKSRYKKQVHWKAADRPTPPGKPQLVSEIDVTPDVVTIRWDPPRFDGGSPITGYLVEHRRYGSPHWVRATPLLVKLCELTLSGLEPGWRYQFRISAENAVGFSSPGELSDLLTVTLQRSIVSVPKFFKELSDATVLENNKIEFLVKFVEQSGCTICWFKDGFEIFSSRRIRILTENDTSVLTIHQAALSDEGEIKCTATNRAGHVSTKAALTVEAPPSIRLPKQYEDGLLFEIGEVMRLKVLIAGRPTPSVFWSHNNDSINNNEHYHIENSDSYSSIRIDQAQRSDRGEYHIRAVNKLDESFASFLVTVTDKPSPPGQAKVIMSLGRSVTISWNLPNDDGGCKIGNYIVEYYRIGWDVWLKAATSRQLSTTIGDLIEGSEYKFRVKAESPYGVSVPSAESDVIFIPDPKRGILTPSAIRKSPDVDYEHVGVKKSEVQVSTTTTQFYESGAPVRPTRNKMKSPLTSPGASPIITRRTYRKNVVDKNIFDRTSMDRDLAYGTPEITVKPESERINRTSLDKELAYQSRETPTRFDVERANRRSIEKESRETPKRFDVERANRRSIEKESRETPKRFDVERATRRSIEKESRETPKRFDVERVNRPSIAKGSTYGKPFKQPDDENTSQMIIPKKIADSPAKNSDIGRVRDLSPNRSERSNNKFQLDNVTSNKIESDNRTSPSRYIDHNIKEKSPEKQNISSTTITPDQKQMNLTNFNEKFSSYQDHDLSNSSEFMLVLLPDEKKGSSSSIRFDFDDNSIPPPMSLSAPELGSLLEMFEPLRNAVSSTELLHEHTMSRFYDALAAEEEEIEQNRRNRENNNKQAIKIPKIQINSLDDPNIVGLERRNSFKRRVSSGSVKDTPLSWSERRHSLKSTEKFEIPQNKLHKFTTPLSNENTLNLLQDDNKKSDLTASDKRELFNVRQRSHSEELEEEEFEKVRKKMAKSKKEKPKRKKLEVKNLEEWDIIDNEPNPSEGSISSISGSDTEFYNYRATTDIFKAIPIQPEDTTYHPRQLIKQDQKQIKDNQPFEILTKPSPLPDPNFVPKPILKQRGIDKPLRKNINTNKSPGLNTNQTQKQNSKEKLLSVFSQSSSSKKNEKVLKKRKGSPSPPGPEETPSISRPTTKPTSTPNMQGRRVDEEIRVVVDHYGDIVRSYGQRRLSTPRVYLNTEDLKAAAETQFSDNSDTDDLIDETPEDVLEDNLKAPTSLVRKRSFTEASSAILRAVKDKVASAFASEPIDDIISPEEEFLILTAQARANASNAVAKKRPSKTFSRHELARQNRKSGSKLSPHGANPHGENWSNLRAPSPNPGGRLSPSPMRRNSLTPPVPSLRRNSLLSSPIKLAKPKMRETTTQTSLYSAKQEELTAKAEIKVRTTMDYITDLAMFVVACWLYLFHSELLAIPVLLIMVYRQLSEEIKKWLPAWLVGKKKVKRK